MSTLYKYRVFCEAEQKYIEVWKHEKPYTCPNDHRHTIAENLTTIIDYKYLDNTTIPNVCISSKAYPLAQGYYMMEGKKYEIGTQAVYTNDYVVPVPMCVYGFHCCSCGDNANDEFDVLINPDTIVGVIVANTAVNDKNIYVSPTVLEHCKAGFHILLDDGVTNEEHLVVSINHEGGYITLRDGVNHVFNGMVTMVKLRVYVVKAYALANDTSMTHKIGYGAFSGKSLTPGTIIRLVYRNSSSLSKTFHIALEYVY